MSDLKCDLITALVERWRLETYTFHLSCGVCTITLEDIALQLEFPIDNIVVTGFSTLSDPETLCYDLLGRSPGDGDDELTTLRFSWLNTTFEYLPSTATEREVMCVVRAYIMHKIGGVLMLDANNNKVHLIYLSPLSDLYATRSYSWGSTVLGTLYRELCRMTKCRAVDIDGCLVLLQSWALYRMPFLVSVTLQTYGFQLVNRWSFSLGNERSYTLLIYRQMIETYAGERFAWMSYSFLDIVAIVPYSTYIHSHLWCINAPLLNFSTIEWYNGDRVL
ncbi:serine/threonine-protein phosphatase 7 long form homolog [Gossypium hirsutum]|uniref:Serine/threonine-protein phosphatase 7 long form homolog n=1 Tax=Gossypium hirsutum TaxID=3635 RepID=A0A1U8JQP7_GOSHI|nr:serine/threonine-protein phosphatase 7 long form homolog [Gossypium hirsutum]